MDKNRYASCSKWQLTIVTAIMLALSTVFTQNSFAQSADLVTEVEGISEYKLANGVKLLLFPDSSKPQFTVNMTVMVGSRHEGYGESGMAHLLEHMLFRGTDKHPDIPKLLKDRGVLNMNGTTNIDRTNYFETLPAQDDNLEFAIAMEADRLINSWIKAEHLAAEMTIVRSEFERGENSPQAILIQRIMDSAYQWHNYGKSTIGNRSDIMRVPATNLRVFYKKYYQPDNVTLVIAGKFDREEAIDLVVKHFGAIPKPTRELPNTYTEEPAQDGERTVVLRRSGNVQYVGLGYHIPSASHNDYAPLQVLASVLRNTPEGPLYESMVKKKLATSAFSFARVGFDPGMMLALAEVPADNDLMAAKQTLIKEMETIGSEGVSEKDVQRAVLGILKQRELSFSNSERFATSLSTWESYGDWRLYFLHRDRLELVTPDDVARVANEYLLPSNRTVGLFYPTETPQRASINGQNFVKKMVDGYAGRAKMAEGEAFDPTPENIQKRTLVGQLSSGIKYALLPKETRGDRVTMLATLHYGTAESLKGKVTACEMLPQLLSRGTKELSFQQYNDKLDELKATVSFSGSTGSLQVRIQTEAQNLEGVLDVVRQSLREPALSAEELEIVREQVITQTESGLTDPMQLAMETFGRKLDPQPSNDVRYTPTINEQIERYKNVTIKDVRSLYKKFLNGQHGELAVVGDFDRTSTLATLDQVFNGWTSKQPYERIEEPANLSIKGERVKIDTPDKANAIYIAGVNTEIGDQHPDYEAVLIGNYIMGGGPLSSRIADRVRKKDGLSYTAATQYRGDSEDERGIYLMFCISNPMNTEKVVGTVREEVDRMLSSGVTGEELEKAKESFLTNRRGGRARESQIASDLVSNLRNGRTMEFQQKSDERIEALTKEKVDAALRKVIDLDRMIIVTAGDFSKVESEK
ncbi:MAG: pitrilysin family protein [Planctomycetota bacterium]